MNSKNSLDIDLMIFIFYRDTYIERLAKETPNDYNDRVIRVAAK